MYGMSIDRTSDLSLVKQLYNQIRQNILTGHLREGEKLPATRILASYFNISRNVVLEVYEQLQVEGFLQSQQGSYTFVAPGSCLTQPPLEPHVHKQQSNPEQDIIDFKYGIPALNHFPRNLWKKAVNQALLDIPDQYLGYNNIAGCLELRSSLSAYLFKTRGVNCSPEQIIITSGSTQAYALITKLLLSHNRNVIIEDPLNYEVRRYLSILGCDLIPIPIDKQGLQTELLASLAVSSPSFTLVTPSHQFPTGGILPIQRRIQLVNFARDTNSYIVEDDYEHEFTYEGNPISSLQGLDPERVLYVGTFSKTLIPALRLGYIVLPYRLLDSFCKLNWSATQQPSAIDQLSLATFINNGQLQRHVVKMNKIYQKRRNKVISELKRHFADNVKILSTPQGLHVTVEFSNTSFSPQVMQKIIRCGVRIYSVERHVMNKSAANLLNQVILGYGNLSEKQIVEGLERLNLALSNDQLRKSIAKAGLKQ